MTRTPRNVTTTSSLDGWDIQTHHGVVAAHVVAGTGFYSDWLASWSDVFGGRSVAYQTQLESLYSEALAKLATKAEQRGANWVVGLSVDIDEISGKGTQMFMITAVGTAVTANKILSSPSFHAAPGAVGADEVKTFLRRKRLRSAIDASPAALDDQAWAFVIGTRMEEAVPGVIQWIASRVAQASFAGWPDSERQKIDSYLHAIGPAPASGLLYSLLQRSAEEADAAALLIVQMSLGNLRIVRELLKHSDPQIRRRALLTLEGDQIQYGHADSDEIDALITEISAAFPDRSQRTDARKLLGGTKEKWICGQCEHANAVTTEYCTNCYRDRRGFTEAELKPDRAIHLLRGRREAIQSILDSAPRESDAAVS